MNAAFPPQQRTKNTTAQLAAWVGIGALLCWFGSPIALVLGLLALRQVRAEPGRYSNETSAVVGIVLGGVGSALLVVALVMGAIGELSPSSAPAAATPATTTSALAGPASASASAGATTAAQDAPAATLPSVGDVEIDRAFFAILDADPGANAAKAVAAKRHMTESAVQDALARVAEYRAALAKEAGKSADKGVVGDLDVELVKHTSYGDFTAIVKFTAIGCPDGPADADDGLRTLVVAAMDHLADNLPAGVDSFKASLWYRGLTCSRAPIGYSASWRRDANRVVLK